MSGRSSRLLWGRRAGHKEAQRFASCALLSEWRLGRGGQWELVAALARACSAGVSELSRLGRSAHKRHAHGPSPHGATFFLSHAADPSVQVF